NQPRPLANTLTRVDSRAGGWLTFDYRVQDGQAFLARINTPLGPFTYDYDHAAAGLQAGGRLHHVRRPDGMQKRYLYEAGLQAGNPYALTGIEIVGADMAVRQRTHTWAYDAESRAILS